MAESLTQALRTKGMTAERLRDQNLPGEGWLVQGYFTEVDEGNRLKRARSASAEVPRAWIYK